MSTHTDSKEPAQMWLCDNCEHTAAYDDLPNATDLLQRLTPGCVFTDKECPVCGALCFPEKPAPTDGPIPEHSAAAQMSLNVRWLIERMNHMHQALRLPLRGGWVTHTEDVVAAVERLASAPSRPITIPIKQVLTRKDMQDDGRVQGIVAVPISSREFGYELWQNLLSRKLVGNIALRDIDWSIVGIGDPGTQEVLVYVEGDALQAMDIQDEEGRVPS